MALHTLFKIKAFKSEKKFLPNDFLCCILMLFLISSLKKYPYKNMEIIG